MVGPVSAAVIHQPKVSTKQACPLRRWIGGVDGQAIRCFQRRTALREFIARSIGTQRSGRPNRGMPTPDKTRPQLRPGLSRAATGTRDGR